MVVIRIMLDLLIGTTHVNEWIGYMTDPAYLRVNGKPFLVFFEVKDMRQVFGSSSAVASALNQLRGAAQAKGLPGVYIVGSVGTEIASADQDGLFPDLSMMLADGYDAIHIRYSGVWRQGMTAGEQSFSILSNGGRWVWTEGAVKSPLPFIPAVMDGWDPRPCAVAAQGGCPWDPQTVTWFNRTPQELTAFLADAITWAESNPQVRVEPSPTPPLIWMESWNELTEGHYILPTIGDGTSFGDSLAEMLATPPPKVRSIVTLSDGGSIDPNRAATGTLTDAAGLPIAGANITIREVPFNGSYAQYQLSGIAPLEAAQAVVGFRVNIQDPWPGFFTAGARPSDFALY
jgi:Glycosyltransferase WbsX